MTPFEAEMLTKMINDAGLDNGKVIKADGLWHIIGASQPKPVNVEPPIDNMHTRGYGGQPAVVIEGRR